MYTRHTNPIRLAVSALLLLVALPLLSKAETQSFTLAPRWNLISFQVTPTDPDPAAVFETLPGFQSAWSYDSSTALWRRYAKPAGTATQQANDATANELLPLQSIQPGRAYWVFISQGTSWDVEGSVPNAATFPSLNLVSGWNMIGIPVGAASVTNAEPVSLLAVLTAAGFDYDAMLTYEGSAYRKMFRPQDTNSPLASLPMDAPFPDFDLQNDLGRGYFIHVLDPAVLRPNLVTIVRPDIDAEPFNNFPSKEDINVTGFAQAAVPRSVDEQDTIRFFPGEDVQTLGIANLGDETGGGGIMLWEVTWTPTTDVDTPEPWIRLFTAPNQREKRDVDGQLLQPYTSLNGVTTLETDTVYLRLDRKNLGRGLHEGVLSLRTSVGARDYQVVVEVGGLEGDFKGYAVIDSVNGRRNPIPDIDLAMTFYEDTKVDGLLRGTIDSSRALLWPVDVPLVGYRIADEGNQFVLGGSFVLPPGDQNAEPYDQFEEGNSEAGDDVDWSDDGLLDVRNPFPFPVQRTVSMEGALVHADPTDGYVVEGNYTEIVHGMSREPIVLSGTFRLSRESSRPFAGRRTISQDTGVEPVVSKSNPTQVSIPAGSSRVSPMNVVTEMELQALQVSLKLSALAHSQLLITLRSPGPGSQELVLYDGRQLSDTINPKLLENVTFPLEVPVRGDLLEFIRNLPGTSTLDGEFWELEILNAGSEDVSLAGWDLRLEGQPVTDVYGVVQVGETPLAGVTVGINGAPISLTSEPSDAEGVFKLSRVPFLPLNFAALRPGFGSANGNNPGLSDLFTRPFVGLEGQTFTPLEQQLISRFNPLAGAPVASAGVSGFGAGTQESPFVLTLQSESSGAPTIAGGPFVSFVGGSVDFYALNPTPSIIWDLGDGTLSQELAVTHSYAVPGLYQVSILYSINGQISGDTMNVVVLPAPGNAPAKPGELGGADTGLNEQALNASYPGFVFQSAPTMAGAIPASYVSGELFADPDIYLTIMAPQTSFNSDETNGFGAAFVSTTPLQHAYAASMDIDLAPRIVPGETSLPFGSDGFEALFSPGFDSSINLNDQGFKDEDFNYALLESLWDNTRSREGPDSSVEYEQDAAGINGLIVWGNSLVVPNLNYAAQLFSARDGTDYVVSQDDDTFHPHAGSTALAGLTENATARHYMMACSIGAAIQTTPMTGASVKTAEISRSVPEDALGPELIASPAPISRNLYFQLHGGILDFE